MINKQLEKIGLEDLEQLQTNSIIEGKTIEYKQQLPTNSDADRKEFLADISSFANATGGDLIYGITEKDGIPKSIDGIEISNVDEEIRKYENIIRDGIEPRIIVTTYPVKISDQKYAFIFRVNKSWMGPHRVIYKGHDKFYSRNSAGKYPLNTSELKTAFTLSHILTEKIIKFKTERISQLVVGNLPLPFYDGGKIVLHIVPLEAFTPNGINIQTIIDSPGKLNPIYFNNSRSRINLDGFLSFSTLADNKAHSFVQLYRNGIIEAVEGLILSSEIEGNSKKISSVTYERELIQSLTGYLNILKEIGVNTPIVIFLTLIGTKDWEMVVNLRDFLLHPTYKIDRDILQLPETIIESYDIQSKDILRPMFDLIWNACGYKRSYNFDEDGNWIN